MPVEAGTENSYEDEYEEAVERKLEEVLREVEGVGNVKVMVTFQSSSEKIIEKDQATNSQTVTESDKQEENVKQRKRRTVRRQCTTARPEVSRHRM